MRLRLTMVVAIAAALALPGAEAGEPALSDAWIALPAPGVPVAAGYLVLDNHGVAPMRIVGARATGFAKAEVHESYREGDRIGMRPRPILEVAPGARLAFAPGGLHLMLFDPADPPAVGAVHEVALVLADGRTLTVRATVRDARAAHH